MVLHGWWWITGPKCSGVLVQTMPTKSNLHSLNNIELRHIRLERAIDSQCLSRMSCNCTSFSNGNNQRTMMWPMYYHCHCLPGKQNKMSTKNGPLELKQKTCSLATVMWKIENLAKKLKCLSFCYKWDLHIQYAIIRCTDQMKLQIFKIVGIHSSQ